MRKTSTTAATLLGLSMLVLPSVSSLSCSSSKGSSKSKSATKPSSSPGTCLALNRDEIPKSQKVFMQLENAPYVGRPFADKTIYIVAFSNPAERCPLYIHAQSSGESTRGDNLEYVSCSVESEPPEKFNPTSRITTGVYDPKNSPDFLSSLGSLFGPAPLTPIGVVVPLISRRPEGEKIDLNNVKLEFKFTDSTEVREVTLNNLFCVNGDGTPKPTPTP